MKNWFGKLCEFEEYQLRLIHKATLRILEETGIYVNHGLVLQKCKEFGAEVDFDAKTVKFPTGLVETKLSGFKNALDRGEKPQSIHFAAGGEFDYILDLETGEVRKPTIRDLEDVVKIADKLENIDEVDTAVCLPEIPEEIVDLYTWKTVWTWTNKTGGGGLSRNGNAIRNYSDRGLDYLIRLAAIKAGGADKLRNNPVIGGFVGFASPLRLNYKEVQQMVKLIELGQYVGIGSNVIAGAQAPATIAGVVTVENAERLAGLMCALSISEDARVYFTNHPQYLDMVFSNVSNGSTEHVLAALLGRAMFNYYGFNRHFVSHPAVLTSSHTMDEQTGLEKMMGMLMAGLAGHKGVCSLGGLNEVYSQVQLIIDDEIAGVVKRLLRGVEVSEEEVGLDFILQTGIGGNFLEKPELILEQVRRNYHRPSVLNRVRYPVWKNEGSKTIIDRAREKAKRLLAEDHRKYLTESQISEMDELIAEAERELR